MEAGLIRIPAIRTREAAIPREFVTREVALRIAYFARATSPQAPCFILAPKRLETIYWILAAIWTGRTLALYAPDATEKEMQAASAEIGADCCRDPLAIPLQKYVAAANTGTLPEARADGFRLIVFTSGSSAKPKAVLLPWAALASAAAAHREHFALQESDVWLASLPLHHIGGISIVTRAAILGQDLAFSADTSVETIHYWLESGFVSGMSVVPTLLYRLAQAERSFRWHPKFRFLLIGGAPIPEPIWEKICADFPAAPLFPTYGLSETAAQVLTASASDALPQRRMTLRPLPGVTAEIDPQSGELFVGGPMVYSGYMRGGKLLPRTGARHGTGDLARASGPGAFEILGRCDDLILSGGVNISPLEIESVFLRLVPDAECACVGLPDAEWGEIGVLAYSPGKAGEDLPLDDILRRLRAELSPKKVPKRVVRFENLPKTPSGKVSRRELKKQLLAQI